MTLDIADPIAAFLNVAVGKACEQSSYDSAWGRRSGRSAGTLVVPDHSYEYAIHTAVETDPWWRVDLGKSYRVDRIIIENRDVLRDRILPLRVEVSTDADAWRTIVEVHYEFGSESSGHPLVIELNGQFSVRFVRLMSIGTTCLHLKRLKVIVQRQLEMALQVARICGLPEEAVQGLIQGKFRISSPRLDQFERVDAVRLRKTGRLGNYCIALANACAFAKRLSIGRSMSIFTASRAPSPTRAPSCRAMTTSKSCFAAGSRDR